ncbi:magnesium chelatase [Mycobacterium tuberculosis]|nr:magnesium chelatase [Mycobacterium tuberculosis]
MKPYPFSAIVGHDRLRLALLLCAVRPEIGGALIRGEKGTAKSTAVRGLAALLSVATGSTETGLVELPLGATEDRVVGSLDLQRVMRDGEHAFSPGLLAPPPAACSTSTRSICCMITWLTSCSTPPPWDAYTSNATASPIPTRPVSC